MRYTVHPAASAKLDAINDDVVIVETDNLAEAERAAESAPYIYGAGIKDTTTGKIDFGFGFGQPVLTPDE
jgi:hypothetical protein